VKLLPASALDQMAPSLATTKRRCAMASMATPRSDAVVNAGIEVRPGALGPEHHAIVPHRHGEPDFAGDRHAVQILGRDASHDLEVLPAVSCHRERPAISDDGSPERWIEADGSEARAETRIEFSEGRAAIVRAKK
jgi:hypothetical protein